MKLSNLFALLFCLLSLSNCATYQLSDWQASITLPASQDCYSFNILSGRETRLKAADPKCISRKLKSVWIDSESYMMLRRDIQKNCQLNKCKQITGAFDVLFFKMDQALIKINKRK